MALPPPAQPPDITDESALVRGAAQGDRDAFAALVRRYQRQIFGLALRFLGNPDPARDAAQEIFVKAFVAIDRADPEREFGPWLMTIARNHLRDRLRRRRVRKGDLADTEPDELIARLPTRTPDIEASLGTRQETLALEQALQELPEHYREVVVLHHLQGRSVKEIAGIIGRPEGTVMTWLFRGRSKLKDLLEAAGVRP